MRRISLITRLTALLLLMLGCLHSGRSLAWGWLGHQVAGDITQSYLSRTALDQVRHLLGAETLAEASLWADRMREDPSDFWQREAGPYHYVTVPPGRRYVDLGAPAQGDAVTALRRFGAVLRRPDSSGAERRLALRFALHIVQDLHQPLHVGNGDDRGGNDVAVRVDGAISNLHRVWDVHILESAGRNRREWRSAMDKQGLLRPPGAADTDPLQWIAESAALRDTLYPPVREASPAYLAAQLPRAAERLALAGIRAAAWLNATLDPDWSGAPPPPGATAATAP